MDDFHDGFKLSLLENSNRLNIPFVVFQVGRILQRDRDHSKALVQLDRYEEKVFNLDYDTICHYIGAVDH